MLLIVVLPCLPACLPFQDHRNAGGTLPTIYANIVNQGEPKSELMEYPEKVGARLVARLVYSQPPSRISFCKSRAVTMTPARSDVGTTFVFQCGTYPPETPDRDDYTHTAKVVSPRFTLSMFPTLTS
jgi:hypothetical protein